MTAAIHLAMPRTTSRGMPWHAPTAHGIKGPAISAPTPRAELPIIQAATADVMRNPHRELVMSHAGASFWANQAIKESESHAQAI